MPEPTAPGSPADRPAAVVGRSGMVRRALVGLGALAVFLATLAYFGRHVRYETYFQDESCYSSQAFYFDLLRHGRWNDVAWASFPAIDQPPLHKYLIGFALRVHGYAPPGGLAAAEAWHHDFNLAFGTADMFAAMRKATVVMGALGCVGLYFLGVAVRGPVTGLIAAALLASNPLYYLEARRTVNDVTCAALATLAVAAGLAAWKRALGRGWSPAPGLVAAVGCGVLAGLAALAKLTGLYVLLVYGAWTALALLLTAFPPRRRAGLIAGLILASTVAVGTFVALNPSLTAHPTTPMAPEWREYVRRGPASRFLHTLAMRRKISGIQQETYPDYALTDPRDKLGVYLVQGYGRFGPFGPWMAHPPARYDWGQDRFALLWLPWVLAGTAWAAVRGHRELRAGQPPSAWALLLYAAIANVCVLGYLPMAWDRYLLPVQPAHAVLAAAFATAAAETLARRLARQSVRSNP